ncbi:MAG: SemiSWEET family transporter [bacterium]|nr:SemiSWEET family transporter [bacterium]
MNILDFIFYLPGILFLISGIPQMIKLLRTKRSKDISIWMYLLTCVAVLIIMTDAYIHQNYSILFSNTLSFLVTAINTFLVFKYRKN